VINRCVRAERGVAAFILIFKAFSVLQLSHL